MPPCHVQRGSRCDRIRIGKAGRAKTTRGSGDPEIPYGAGHPIPDRKDAVLSEPLAFKELLQARCCRSRRPELIVKDELELKR
jgi:hypothetical protein